MNVWYEKLAKIWIFNRKFKFKVTCLPLKSGELWTEAWDIMWRHNWVHCLQTWQILVKNYHQVACEQPLYNAVMLMDSYVALPTDNSMK